MPERYINMKDFKLTTKEEYALKTASLLERLDAFGLNQTEIAIYLGVSDRAVRKWEYFQSVPSGVQYLNLSRLCKELGA